MNCPACKTKLVKVQCGAFRMFTCGGCKGYLGATRRIKTIQRSQQRPIDEVGSELRDHGADTLEKVRCPRCRAPMEKKKLNRPIEFHTDHCKECELTWLDGGELALLEVAYRTTSQGREAAELKRRMNEMSPQRKAEFERNLAKCPEPEDPIMAAFGAAFLHVLSGDRRWEEWDDW